MASINSSLFLLHISACPNIHDILKYSSPLLLLIMILRACVLSRCCGVVRSGGMISKTKYREKYTVHKSDVKMPQGWKEYTGEKTELDRWEIIRNAFTSKRLKEFSDTSISGLQDDLKSKSPRLTNRSNTSADTMMFYEEGGIVKTMKAPPHILNEAGLNSGAYAGESDSSNASHKNRFLGSKSS